jgi:hypothetical protein
MTAWVLLIVVGSNVFSVNGIATEADCNTLAAGMAQAVTNQELQHSCISYESATTVSEVHVFGPNAGRQPAAPFSLKQKGPSQGKK